MTKWRKPESEEAERNAISSNEMKACQLSGLTSAGVKLKAQWENEKLYIWNENSMKET